MVLSSAVGDYKFPVGGVHARETHEHALHREVQEGFGIQKLDGYEQELGFVPIWVDIDKAIQVNQQLRDALAPPEWLRREIYMLEYLKKNLFN
jgi:8-oxo-dGTP pyrophosphatase MutT (NUDIX family)